MSLPSSATLPPADSECRALEASLPLVSTDLLTVAEAARVARHCATCARCQRLLALYQRMDGALRETALAETPTLVPALRDQLSASAPAVERAPGATRVAPPSQTRPSRRRRWPTSVAALAAVLLVSLFAGALFAHGGLFGARTHGGGAPFSAPNGAPGAAPIIRVGLMSVAMVSAHDVWAFGWEATYEREAGTLTSSESDIFHYDGSAWSKTVSPVSAVMISVYMLSATEGWAVGGNTILRYTQGRWQVDTVYAPDGRDVSLNAITMVSPAEGWAVGNDATAHAVILHYSDGQWTPADLPDTGGWSSLRGIAMVSPTEGWAVGSQSFNGPETSYVLHLRQGRWSEAKTGVNGSLNGVAAVSPDDVWAVGEVSPASGPGLIVHYQRGVWTQVDSPSPNMLHGVTMLSPNEGWAVGDGALTLHYANGVWTKQGLTIHHVAMDNASFATPGEGWAVGECLGCSDDGTTLFHYKDGAWSVYPIARLAATQSHATSR